MALAFVLVSELSFAQTVTVNHIVTKGETLESIAQRYSTTTEAIIELNPEAAQVVYVGMELKIPVTVAKSESEPVKTQQAAVVTETPATTVTSVQNGNNSATTASESFKHWDAAYQLGVGYLPKPKGIDYQLSIGANYYPIQQLYVGLRIGYNGSSQFKSGNYDCHFITIPIEVGGKFKLNNGHAIMPYMGLDLNICVKATYDMKTGKDSWAKEYKKAIEKDAKGKLAADFRLGLKYGVGSDGFIGAAMVVPVNDNQKGFVSSKVYPEITYGFGF